MQAKRYNVTMPPDWWDAFSRAAEAAGKTVSEWLREAAIAKLPKASRDKLSEARGAGRPKNRE